MRRLPDMENIWRNGDHIGSNRPTVRATITRPQMKLFTYALKSLGSQNNLRFKSTDTVNIGKLRDNPQSLFTGDDVSETYATHWVHDQFQPLELPNIKSIEWSRDTQQDAAEMTLVMFNASPRVEGQNIGTGQENVYGDSVYDLDEKGYFSPSRGKTIDSARWGHQSNPWTGLLMPDNIIKTFEGYGVDFTTEPESDPNLVQTGVWMIDDIEFQASGLISIKCRDLGRLLLQQGFESPVLPLDFNPVGFKAWTKDELTRKVSIDTITKTQVKVPTTWSDPGPTQRSRVALTKPTSSSYFWRVGTNGDGGPGTIKDPLNYHGRGPQHTLDDNGGTFWISVGNSSPRAPFAYEWVEFDLPGSSINEVVVQTAKAGYQCYISVMQDGKWQGKQKINYHEAGVGRNNSNIPFIVQTGIGNENRQTLQFPPVSKAQKLRITLGNLQNWSANFGSPAYRGAIRTVEAYATQAAPGTVHNDYIVQERTTQTSEDKMVVLDPGPVGENPGGGSARYSDYTDIVKLICAWGGFYWPQNITEATSNSTRLDPTPDPHFRKYTFDVPDTAVLGHVPGRVWGDFMTTGQSGPQEIGSDNFTAKSLREGINLIADTVSFNFWIDELGSVQWRYPNIDTVGNWVTDYTDDRIRTQQVWDIDEKQVLTDMTTTISSRRVAEIVVLKNLQNSVGYISSGYNPNPTGLRRSVIWTDAQYLNSNEEAKIMGDLIATRMLFNYRQNTITVPGFPGLQIDDQILLHERTTSDSFYHLITGISNSHDNETGEWIMTLTTMWLGDTPEGRWTVPRRTRETRDTTGLTIQPVVSKDGRQVAAKTSDQVDFRRLA